MRRRYSRPVVILSARNGRESWLETDWLMAKHRIELIYEHSCPNVPAARAVIRAACTAKGIAPQWVEWDSQDEALPEYARGFGSPTILINGRDVAGDTAGAADCCRLYISKDGMRGVPDVSVVLAALTAED